MLKINLLPVRQLKKRAKAIQELMGMLLLFILILTAVGIVGFFQSQNIAGLETKIQTLQNEKNSYNTTLQRIAKLKKDREEIVRKIEIIKKLKSDSSLTVRVLDEVANKVDNQRMWLDSLQQQNSSLRLSGVALDNQTIAQFMDNLKESPFVQDVTLTNSSLKVVSGRNLKSFELNCSVAQPEKSAPELTAVK